MTKVLFVLTSANKLLNDKPTGWYLPECAHPYYVFKEAGYEVEFASPAGGEAPLDPGSAEAFKEDPECKKFNADPEAQNAVKTTQVLSKVDDAAYAAVFYVGGHGPCFDLAVDPVSIALAEKVFASGRVLSAVCHGPAAFHKVKGPDGKSIFAGRKATCFSNEEEEQVGLTKAIPFLVETDIKENGGTYVHERQAWGEEVTVDKTGGLTLICGANPASATATAHAIIKELKASA
ncbi:hypothetical protein P7C70_g8958, partial [Phenoliferia sp. Uapishka_3]